MGTSPDDGDAREYAYRLQPQRGAGTCDGREVRLDDGQREERLEDR